MKFTPTKYSLVNYSDGRRFEDTGWLLADPQSKEPSLIRAEYERIPVSTRGKTSTDSTDMLTGFR